MIKCQISLACNGCLRETSVMAAYEGHLSNKDMGSIQFWNSSIGIESQFSSGILQLEMKVKSNSRIGIEGQIQNGIGIDLYWNWNWI